MKYKLNKIRALIIVKYFSMYNVRYCPEFEFKRFKIKEI